MLSPRDQARADGVPEDMLHYFPHTEDETPSFDDQGPEQYFNEIPADEAGELDALLLTRSQLRDLPKPQPLITDTINQGNTVVISANPGAGKSFLVLDWLACLVTRKDWQGRPTHLPNNSGVLYLAAEGVATIDPRLEAWETAWKHQISDDLIILPEALHLMDYGMAVNLAKLVKRRNISVLVVDTLARVMAGDGDENSAQDMSNLLNNLEIVRKAMPDNGTLIIVHHSNKAGSMRGSSALMGAVDVSYTLTNDAGLITLACDKRKDDVEGGDMTLRLQDAGDNAVLVNYRAGDLIGNPLAEEMKTLTYLMPMTKTELRNATSLPEISFYRHLNAGLESGEITMTNDKTPKFNLRD